MILTTVIVMVMVMVMVMVIGALQGWGGVNSGDVPEDGDRSGYAMNNLKPGPDRGHTLAGAVLGSVLRTRKKGGWGVGGGWPGPAEARGVPRPENSRPPVPDRLPSVAVMHRW